MNEFDHSAYDASLQQRLADAASRQLGAPVTFLRWDLRPDGASVPVFRVPAAVADRARELGLTVETQEEAAYAEYSANFPYCDDPRR